MFKLLNFIALVPCSPHYPYWATTFKRDISMLWAGWDGEYTFQSGICPGYYQITCTEAHKHKKHVRIFTTGWDLSVIIKLFFFWLTMTDRIISYRFFWASLILGHSIEDNISLTIGFRWKSQTSDFHPFFLLFFFGMCLLIKFKISMIWSTNKISVQSNLLDQCVAVRKLRNFLSCTNEDTFI